MTHELRIVKGKYEDDEHKYTEVSKQLVLSERLCKELEDNYLLFKSQNKNINDDIKMIQTYTNSVKDFIDTFENKNQKDNQHKLKMLVNLKINQENTQHELN